MRPTETEVGLARACRSFYTTEHLDWRENLLQTLPATHLGLRDIVSSAETLTKPLYRLTLRVRITSIKNNVICSFGLRRYIPEPAMPTAETELRN